MRKILRNKLGSNLPPLLLSALFAIATLAGVETYAREFLWCDGTARIYTDVVQPVVQIELVGDFVPRAESVSYQVNFVKDGSPYGYATFTVDRDRKVSVSQSDLSPFGLYNGPGQEGSSTTITAEEIIRYGDLPAGKAKGSLSVSGSKLGCTQGQCDSLAGSGGLTTYNVTLKVEVSLESCNACNGTCPNSPGVVGGGAHSIHLDIGLGSTTNAPAGVPDMGRLFLFSDYAGTVLTTSS